MGSSISRINDVYDCYKSFCEELNEIPGEYINIQEHAKELIKKYKVSNDIWWYYGNE